MNISASRKISTNSLIQAISSFAVLAFLFTPIPFVLRIIELGYNFTTHARVQHLPGFLLSAFFNDLLFLAKLLAFVSLVYVPLFVVSPRVSKWFFLLFVTIFLLADVSLMNYFSQAMVPLGADVYAYSLADIQQTMRASGHVNVVVAAIVIAALIACIVAISVASRKVVFSRKISFSAFFAVIIIFACSSFINISHTDSRSEFENNLALNKTDFFISQSVDYFSRGEKETDIYADNYIADYADGQASVTNFEYTDPSHFPFLHVDKTSDVLAPFFKKATAPPNIVILLVEGLGRAFTNEGAYLGNFTPFIDSLSGQSLYWDNFLSEGGRTFAVLPSVLGSLPFLKNGFAEMGDKMPAYLSLVSLLKSNHYYTSFYYGGDSKFDNMQLFLKKSSIDQVNDQSNIPAAFAKMPPGSSGFSWGFGDKELFRYYLSSKENKQQRPFLDVILTLSTHTPFLINDQQQYLNKFEERLQQLGFNEDKKKEYRNYKYQYASILFTDDAIKNFIASYAKRADFANTIFFITGDHRMPEIPMISKIDRYHVPLIVYSPLLTRHAKFSSISTHFDITPSIVSYLKNNYQLQFPSLESWLGTGLDTSRSFHNIHAYPLIQTKSDMVDFIAEENLLNNDKLNHLQPGMQSSISDDKEKTALLERSFDEFKKKNESIINGSQLLPDSIYRRYFPH